MKTFISFIPLFLLCDLAGQGKWELVHEQPVLNYETIDFISADTGWTLESNQLWINQDVIKLFKTTDGGKTWMNIFNELHFIGIDFYNDTLGWAIGRKDTQTMAFFKTCDGGLSWNKQNLSSFIPTGLEVVTDKIVLIFAENDKVYKTVDGGDTWNDITPSNYGSGYSVWGHFYNKDTGVIVIHDSEDGPIFRTENGGKTWESKNSWFNRIGDIDFIDNTLGYIINSSRLYITNDAFKTWSLVSDTLNILCCYFYNADTILAVTNSPGWFINPTNIIRSTNGGITWENTSHMDLSAIGADSNGFYVSGEKTYYFAAAESMSLVLESDDNGIHWHNFEIASDLDDIHSIDPETAFAISRYGILHFQGGFLFKTTDAGQSMQFIMGLNSLPQKIHFFNKEVGGISGMSRPPNWSTKDGGENWISDLKLKIADFYSLNDYTGWILGGRNIEIIDTTMILQTWDGGLSWDTIYRISNIFNDIDDRPIRFKSMFFTSENKGFIVGEGGLILMLTGQGEWARIESGTTLPLQKIFFIDEDVGFISVGYSNMEGMSSEFLKTEDGGYTWNIISESQYFIEDFMMENKDLGWAIGSYAVNNGVLIETIDGGEHWAIADSSLPKNLHRLHFSNNLVWAVGNNTVILKYTPCDTCLTPIKTTHPITANASLQNYPNPFKSITTIRYGLSRNGFAELTIYDISGRQVCKLVSKEQQAGTYEIQWNAAILQPSIYFCELRAPGSRLIIKMILTC